MTKGVRNDEDLLETKIYRNVTTVNKCIETLADSIHLHFKQKENRSYPLLLTRDRIEEELNKLITDSDFYYILECRGEQNAR